MLGCLFDFTLRARARTVSKSVRENTLGLSLLVLHLFVFKSSWVSFNVDI